MPKSDRGRFSAKRKREAVLRLLRGEDLDLVSRELGVNGSTLAKWRESFLEGGFGAWPAPAPKVRPSKPWRRAALGASAWCCSLAPVVRGRSVVRSTRRRPYCAGKARGSPWPCCMADSS